MAGCRPGGAEWVWVRVNVSVLISGELLHEPRRGVELDCGEAWGEGVRALPRGWKVSGSAIRGIWGLPAALAKG